MNKLTQLTAVLTLLLFSTISNSVFAERTPTKIAQHVNDLQRKNTAFNTIDIVRKSNRAFSAKVAETVSRYAIVDIQQSGLNKILNDKPEFLKLEVPFATGNRELLLYKVNISPNGFTLETSDGHVNPAVGTVVHYRGIVNGDPNSIVSFSFSNEETMGMISTDEGNFVLGKTETPNDNEYVLYNDKDLVPSYSYDCSANTANLVQPYNTTPNNQNPSVTSANCVNWYYEIDYDVYVGKGSLANVNSYIQGVFNQVATLYDNEGVSITLQTVYVWTATDPYTGPTTSNYLNQFGAYRTSFAGDLANLVGYDGGGGVAYINGLCSSSTQYRMGYMGISSSYNTVPTYSWTVEVITHEDGHLLGSRHTHDCVWNGNNTRIDDCGPQAGYAGTGTCAAGPLPSSGTIMSYCHLVGGIGINFNNGFGPQPSALILNNVNNASCLSACSSCQTPTQPGNIAGATSYCQTISQTYSVSAVAGATSYTWTLPNGWTGTSTTNSINVTTSGNGGTVSVVAVNSCGDSPARTLTVTGNTSPAQPGNLVGGISVCEGISQTYSVQPVSGATSYQWTLPNGWTGSSTTNTIVVTTGSLSGNVSVRAVNGCGNSAYRSASVIVTSTPAQPLSISGEATVCPGLGYVYSVPTVSGATSYTWSLPNGWTGNSTSNIITTVSGINAGDIEVTASNTCGTSAARIITTSLAVAPNKPKGIAIVSGNVKVCPGDVVNYSIPSIAYTTSYTWTAPVGGTITSGQGTTDVTVTYNSGFIAHDTITVVANNGCAESPLRFKRVYRNTPGKPTVIAGQAAGNCNSTSVPYQVNGIPGMTYNWILSDPSATIVNGQGTNSIEIDYNQTFVSALLSVTANNACGTSNIRKLFLKAIPSQPGLIVGTTSPCANDQAVPYSIDPVDGALTYTWTVPTGARINDGTVTSTSAKLTTTATNVTVNFKTTDGLVKVKATNACGTSANRKLDVVFSCRIASNEIDITDVNIFPNPASSDCNVQFTTIESGNYTIRITDLAGKTLRIEEGSSRQGLNKINIKLNDIVPGIYFIETSVNGNRTTKKLTIK